ncbi:MAG: hypothetical protein FOGNACKC_00659 [Anaerolineae bacterium]|nr:hypothetical protein [Anaerolineae bacterium]
MNRWGCAGLLIGGVIGLVLVGLFLAVARSAPSVEESWPAAALPPDVTIFVAEPTLSRIASEKLGRPARLDFEPGGQMMITSRVAVAGYEPVVTLGLSLQLQGANVVSHLHWVKLGWLTIPANWLPASARDTAATVGESIQRQIPPDFTLVGLDTTAGGLNFQLKWVGR